MEFSLNNYPKKPQESTSPVRKSQNVNENSVKAIIEKLKNATFTADNAPDMLNEIRTTDVTLTAQVESIAYQMREFDVTFQKELEAYDQNDTTKTHITRELFVKEYEMTKFYQQLYSWTSFQYELSKLGWTKVERVLAKIESLKIEARALELRKEQGDKDREAYMQSNKYLAAMSFATYKSIVSLMQKNEEKIINSLLMMSYEQSQMLMDVIGEVKINGTLSKESIADFTKRSQEMRTSVAKTLNESSSTAKFDQEMTDFEKQIDKMDTTIPKKQTLPNRLDPNVVSPKEQNQTEDDLFGNEE